MIFDASVQEIRQLSANGTPGPPTGGWSVGGGSNVPIGLCIDQDGVGQNGEGYVPFLTNQYGMTSANTLPPPTPGGVPVQPGDPVNMTPIAGGVAAQGNSTIIALTNTDTDANPQNFRFRHLNNSACNCLMVDGHVQSFNFNTAEYNQWVNANSPAPVPTYTNLLRKNIYVDAPTQQY